jgi:hypothetical protein
MTAEEIQKVNAWREAKYGEPRPLDASPGVRFLDYGKNKEGYWTAADIPKQTEDLLDALECLHPDWQFVLEFDWSSGHAAHRPGCLSVHAMNVNWGGKQSIAHATKLTKGCLGPHNPQLKEGDMQFFYFRRAEERGDGKPDPPPWYAEQLKPEEYVGQAKVMSRSSGSAAGGRRR